MVLTLVLIIIGSSIALMLIIALIAKRGYHIQREITIDAPLAKVFDYIRYLKNWDHFNKGSMEDADRKKEYKGTDGTAGYLYSWSGNKKAGAGEKEIMSIIEGKEIRTELRFIKPMKVTGYTNMTTDPLSENQTKVTCSNASTLPYPFNFMLLFITKNIARDMDTSLSNLKNILENK